MCNMASTIKKVQGFPYKRLVFYKHRADSSYWDKHWKQLQIEGLLGNTFFKELFCKYLPNKGKILDAGCGLGQYVKMLTDIGYGVEGIDFSRLAIRKAKKFDRKLSLIVGDVLSLPFRACSFNACISLGVVEHFEKGPEDAIREMYNVLAEDGVILISVPFFSPLRQIKARMRRYEKMNESAGEFYQYAFTMEEFASILKQCGFLLLKVIKYGAVNGLQNEMPFLMKISYYFVKPRNNRIIKGCRGRILRIVKQVIVKILNSRLICEVAAHMMLFVVKKVN